MNIYLPFTYWLWVDGDYTLNVQHSTINHSRIQFEIPVCSSNGVRFEEGSENEAQNEQLAKGIIVIMLIDTVIYDVVINFL